MIPITRCLIDTPERRTKWRYPRASDWIGGGLIGAAIWLACWIA